MTQGDVTAGSTGQDTDLPDVVDARLGAETDHGHGRGTGQQGEQGRPTSPVTLAWAAAR